MLILHEIFNLIAEKTNTIAQKKNLQLNCKKSKFPKSLDLLLNLGEGFSAWESVRIYYLEIWFIILYAIKLIIILIPRIILNLWITMTKINHYPYIHI